MVLPIAGAMIASKIGASHNIAGGLTQAAKQPGGFIGAAVQGAKAFGSSMVNSAKTNPLGSTQQALGKAVSAGVGAATGGGGGGGIKASGSATGSNPFSRAMGGGIASSPMGGMKTGGFGASAPKMSSMGSLLRRGMDTAPSSPVLTMGAGAASGPPGGGTFMSRRHTGG